VIAPASGSNKKYGWPMAVVPSVFVSLIQIRNWKYLARHQFYLNGILKVI